MFSTKKDVDRHVADILSKIKNENEQNLRGFNFAKMYFTVNEYATAKRYLAGFLSLKQLNAPAHKLMAQVNEKSGQLEAALQSYKRSLEIDDKQKDVVLKICELYCQLPVDPERARYWADRAEKLFPHNEVVFRLRESLVSADGEQNAQELEELITNELLVKPHDVDLRIKLLRLYLDTERVKDAYEHAVQIERLEPYSNSLEWCYCLIDVYEVYLEEQDHKYTPTLSRYLLSALDRLISLSLSNTDQENRQISFDHHLFEASVMEGEMTESFVAFMTQMKGQLYFHMATITLKRVKQEHGNPKEASRMAAALFLAAYGFKPLNIHSPWFVKASTEEKKMYTSWHDLACFRLSQAGHVVGGMCREDPSKWLGKVRDHVGTPQSMDKIYQRVFNSRGQKKTDQSSFFMSNNFLEMMSQEFPSRNVLQDYDSVAQVLRADSLHHLVWLALQQYNIKCKVQPTYSFRLFDGLPYSAAKLVNPTPESLCLLDVQAFLYATVRCSALALDELQSMSYVSPDTPTFLPANICERLCTAEQSNWWTASYKLFYNKDTKNLGELRRTLQHGIEVIRCIGQHGMDVNLVVHLAETFADRATELKDQSDGNETHLNDVSHLEARATLYWRAVISMLERLNNNVQTRVPKQCLFPNHGRDPSVDEANALLETGRFYLACQWLNEGNHEEAISAFERLHSPYASYYQSLALKKLAGEEFGNKAREAITSEMRSRHIILLTRSRDALYLTLDRIRGDKKHPLNRDLSHEIEDIETRLARIDPDTVQRHEFETGSEESLSTQDSEEQIPLQPDHDKSITPLRCANHSTPFKSLKFQSSDLRPAQAGEHLRPSPERLDAQIRSLVTWQDTFVNILVEQNKALLATNSSIVEQLKENRLVVEKLTTVLEEMQKKITFVGKSRRRQNRRTHSSRRPPSGGQQHSQVDDDGEDEDDEDYYDGYYYDEEDEDYDARDHEGADFQYNRAYASKDQAPNNDYPYGQTTGLQGNSTITYAPPVPGQGLVAQSGYTPCYGAPVNNPQVLVGQHPMASVPPAYFHPGPPTMFTGLPFSEGQKLPEFHFNMDPTHGLGPVISQPEIIQATLAVNSSVVLPPVVTMVTDTGIGSLTASNLDTAAPASLVSSNTVSILSANSNPAAIQTNAIVPHAFQIALPPHAVILLTPTSLAPSNANIGAKPTFVGSSLTAPFSATKEVSAIVTPFSNVPRIRRDTDRESDSYHEEDSVGHDFTPVIPLPAEVELKTGEEDETILFQERAKLFRYVGKEWKDRGIGVLKILHNESSAKIRILMRRDQTLKTCANHYILPDMSLTPMKNVDKAWLWAAQDFADEEMKMEQFCVKFKTADVAQLFKQQFDVAKEVVAKNAITTVAPSSEKADGIFGEQFIPKAGSWNCPVCLLNNNVERKTCLACETPNPVHKDDFQKENVATTATAPAQFKFGFSPSSSFASPTTAAPAQTSGNLFKFGISSLAQTSQASTTTSFSAFSTGSQFSTSVGVPAFKFGVITTSTTSTSTIVPPKTSSMSFESEALDTGSPSAFDKDFVFGSARPISQVKPSGFVFGASPVKSDSPVVEPRGPASSLLSSLASKQQQDASKDKQSSTETVTTSANTFTFGGFSFKSTPVIKSTEEQPPTNVKDKNNKKSAEPAKPNPFAKFSFNLSSSATSTMSGQEEPNGVLSKSIFASPSSSTFSSFSALAAKQSDTSPSESAAKGNAASAAHVQKVHFERSPRTKSESQDDFVPTADFSPVISLPQLVDLKTGEEDEEKLFGERAKLFRYTEDSKEWKERGIGEMKLLRHRTTKRVRILMRREQVLKLCANHYITPAMKLQPMSNSDKAWIWIAHDFSDGELKQEKFAVKFKNSSLAVAFKDAYEKAQNELENSSSNCSEEVTSTATELQPLSEMFKPKVGSWECPACGIQNEKDLSSCAACQTGNPLFSAAVGVEEKSPARDSTLAQQSGLYLTSMPVFKFGFQSSNGLSGPTPSVLATPKSSPFKFGQVSEKGQDHGILRGMLSDCESSDLATINTTGSKFSFGASLQKPDVSSSSGVIEFQFGTPQPFNFNFGGVRSESPTKTPKSPVDVRIEYEPDEDSRAESEGDSIYFHPVIPLPDKVDVRTGEEEEEVLYCQRAKLYRLAKSNVENEWKERGIGDFKLLLQPVTGKIRLLMRREQVLKICCNHYLTPELSFVKKDDKSYMWYASDFSDGELKEEHLAIRFKTAEIAQRFYEVVTDAQNQLKSGRISFTASTPTSEVKSTSSLANFSFKLDDDQQAKSSPTSPFSFGTRFSNLGSVTPTVSIFGGSSPTTKLNFNTPTSSVSKEDNQLTGKTTDVEVVWEKKAVTDQEKKAADLLLPPNFYSYEQKPSCSGCRGCDKDADVETEDSGVEVVWQTKPSEEQVEKALALMLPATFYLYESRPPCPGCRGCSDSMPEIGPESSIEPVTKPVVEIASLESEYLDETLKVDSEPKLFMNTGSGAFSFANLAQQTNIFESSASDSVNFAFAGAGQTVFGDTGVQKTGEEGGGDENGEDVDSSVHDPHFEPIIPLPKLVEIITGEEDEDKLFCQRCKLYRYDGPTKQWKERGTGEMKILKHQKTGRFRLLMRREQIHKIVCNHAITLEIELKPMHTSETAVCWFATDFAEENPQMEEFAVRFKNTELTNQFCLTVQKCQEELRC